MSQHRTLFGSLIALCSAASSAIHGATARTANSQPSGEKMVSQHRTLFGSLIALCSAASSASHGATARTVNSQAAQTLRKFSLEDRSLVSRPLFDHFGGAIFDNLLPGGWRCKERSLSGRRLPRPGAHQLHVPHDHQLPVGGLPRPGAGVVEHRVWRLHFA